MEQQEEEEGEALISELKRQMDNEDLDPEQKIMLLNNGLNKVLNSAAFQKNSGLLTLMKAQLYHSGILRLGVRLLSQHPSRPQGNWSATATLAHLISSCCVGAEPGRHSETFLTLFLPSVMDGLLSLANQLKSQVEGLSLFRKVMDSVGWLLSAHTHLTVQVFSSTQYEQIQLCDDITVSLLCIQMWIQTCTVSSKFLSDLSDDAILLLLEEAVCQLAHSSDAAVGGASIRLILLMARGLELRLPSLKLNFKGLDRLLEKDWRGRGFDQDVDQLVAIIQSEKPVTNQLEESTERVRAASVIQATWRSYQTRRRVKNLNRAVSMLQRRYRSRKRHEQEQQEAQRQKEELKYQVCVRRQQARRSFHQRQLQLLQLLPPEQVQPYLEECKRRAAIVIQSFWRGFRERRRYKNTLRHALRQKDIQEQAARTLQRAVRRFLGKRAPAKVPFLVPLWIGQEGLTDSRRAELQQQVDNYISVHRSSRVSPEECVSLHQEVQLLLQAELQRGDYYRREEQRVAAVLACTHTQLELLRDAPPLSVVTEVQANSFLSPSASIAAQARDAQNAVLQASRLPWWRMLGELDAGVGSCHAHLQELEAELGGLFIVGPAKDSKLSEVD
ncbi:IQ calmodulin-binding motif-containing protein 1 [Nothobranchius furzeri]|uniref:IQ motif containing B1 n=2 Tax=Nothobranchius TaxID=28779 RepID=A0A1A8UKZ1_NOTFU|nr:transcript variant X4 [Nothobranchius furzeri]KAF7207138.1 transcript variant X3 [Nothobranchius furzeri]KAF7207139.1 transcript variant X1 [Nothobranchius furzeri]KAF7207140.1 transcript variant X2 [Nothobranchius furzeri]